MVSSLCSSFVVCLVISVAICHCTTLCTPDEIAQENFRKLATANNEMALNLLRQVGSDESNVFFSPLSLSAAFGMLYYGTKGQTAKELRNVLGYETAEIPEELVHQTFHQYLTESLTTSDSSAYVLNSANAVLLDERLKMFPTYKNDVQELYQASVADVDFRWQGPQIVNAINKWVAARTNGKIDKLLDELSPTTALVLLNAIYFKGTWKTQFEPSRTTPVTFYQNGIESATKNVPMMRLTEKVPYTALQDLQAVELPYKGENISVIILLPEDLDGLASLQQGLSINKLSDIRQRLYETEVHLSIPKFKIEYSKEMSRDFQDLGMQDVFQPGADFSGLAEDKNIFVSQVLHKAVLEVNEEGSEAAAVTGIISNRMRPILEATPYFVADHPFLFAIVDKRSDMILFLGRVTSL